MQIIMSSRIDFIDLAKGFCIMLVVFTHITGYFDTHYYFEDALSIFRMPLYFFLSGLFFKPYDGFISFLKRKINKLLIPFLAFYLTTSVLLPHILSIFGYSVRNSDIYGINYLWAFITLERFPNMPIWFLICLFVVNCFFYFLYKICRLSESCHIQNVFIFGGLNIICGLLGYFLGANGINLPMYTDSALTALPFFYFGFLFNRYTKILLPSKYDSFLPVIIVILFIVTYIFSGKVIYSYNIFFNTPVWAIYLCGLSGTLGIIFTSKLIHHLPGISYFGRYSIMILLTHNLIIQFLLICFKKANLPIATTGGEQLHFSSPWYHI